jgi:hypothetical protein
MLPADVGTKLTGRVQDAPTANVPADEAVLPINGQAVAPVLFKLKFVEMLGFAPLDGIGKVSVAFPLFDNVTVCGLSLLVELTFVLTKFSALTLALTFRIRSLPPSDM